MLLKIYKSKKTYAEGGSVEQLKEHILSSIDKFDNLSDKMLAKFAGLTQEQVHALVKDLEENEKVEDFIDKVHVLMLIKLNLLQQEMSGVFAQGGSIDWKALSSKAKQAMKSGIEAGKKYGKAGIEATKKYGKVAAEKAGEAYEATKEKTKEVIHDEKKKVTLAFIDDFMRKEDKSLNKTQKEFLKHAYSMIKHDA
jgi:hypothetical protein